MLTVEGTDDIIQLTHYLWLTAKDCKDRHNAYWQLYYKYKSRSDLLSVPLIILTSGMGLTSIIQLGQSTPDFKTLFDYIVAGLGISSTILSGLQRYLRYAERAVIARNIAKSFSRIAYRIEVTLQEYESDPTDMSKQELLHFNTHIQHDIESVTYEVEDLPKAIRMRSGVYERNLTTTELRKNVITSKIKIKQSINHLISRPGINRVIVHKSSPQLTTTMTLNSTNVTPLKSSISAGVNNWIQSAKSPSIFNLPPKKISSRHNRYVSPSIQIPETPINRKSDSLSLKLKSRQHIVTRSVPDLPV